MKIQEADRASWGLFLKMLNVWIVVNPIKEVSKNLVIQDVKKLIETNEDVPLESAYEKVLIACVALSQKYSDYAEMRIETNESRGILNALGQMCSAQVEIAMGLRYIQEKENKTVGEIKSNVIIA
jgi:hypothetical protein